LLAFLLLSLLSLTLLHFTVNLINCTFFCPTYITTCLPQLSYAITVKSMSVSSYKPKKVITVKLCHAVIMVCCTRQVYHVSASSLTCSFFHCICSKPPHPQKQHCDPPMKSHLYLKPILAGSLLLYLQTINF